MEGILAGILGLGVLLLAWRANMRARETAVEVCRRTCRAYGVQLLDDTVALARWRVVRGGGRLLALRRIYAFEVSADGHSREGGSVTLTGHHVDAIWIPGPPE